MKIDFSNTEVAFKSKSLTELRQSYFLFKTLSHPFLVNSGKAITKLSFRMGLPVRGVIKATVYEHFVGGESIEECNPAIMRLLENKVNTILDYSVEGKESEADFDRTMNTTLKTIEVSKTHVGIPLTVFKPTGVGRFALYEKVNKKETLSASEEAEWERVINRFYTIAQAAYDAGTPVMVDAEESWIQDCIDDLVQELMMKYNTVSPMVYNTLQMYRWDRIEYLKNAWSHADRHGYKMGMKIVRGAYMEKERDRALEHGYTDPIQPSKEATDHDYNQALSFILDHIDTISVVAGTHNEESSQLLVDLMNERGLSIDDPRIWFAQLYGMSDHISFNLAHQGFNVVKYVPFGPVQDVMPYLFRRAEENTSVAGQTGRELTLIDKELERRKKLAV